MVPDILEVEPCNLLQYSVSYVTWDILTLPLKVCFREVNEKFYKLEKVTSLDNIVGACGVVLAIVLW